MARLPKTTVPSVVIEAGKKLEYEQIVIAKGAMIYNKFCVLAKKFDPHEKLLGGAALYLALPEGRQTDNEVQNIVNVLYNVETGKVIDVDSALCRHLRDIVLQMICHVSSEVPAHFQIPQDIMALFLKNIGHHGMGETLMYTYCRVCLIILNDFSLSLHSLRYDPAEVCIAIMDIVKRMMNVSFAPILESQDHKWQKMLWSGFNMVKSRRVIRDIYSVFVNERKIMC